MSNASDGPDARLLVDTPATPETAFNTDPEAENPQRRLMILILTTVFCDIPASIAFWYFFLFVEVTNNQFYTGLGVSVSLMTFWRLFLAYGPGRAKEGELQSLVPYTCGTATVGGKEMVLVATIHISPRSPKDVEAVVISTQPDVVMIELDEERLERMRDPEPEERFKEPDQADLQPIVLIGPGSQRDTIYAQRALWNAELKGQTLKSSVVFDDGNPHGLGEPSVNVSGKMALVKRGGPEGAKNATFAAKSHHMYCAGVQAVLCINKDEKPALPVHRVGGASIWNDMRIAFHTRSCGFPPAPVLLLSHADGERVRTALQDNGADSVSVEMLMCDDRFPRRTLRRRLCQNFALIFSGIGILYGVIQCFAVEVGGEFLAAEQAAKAARVPCACVDVDLNKFWSRLGAAVAPTPCNLWDALMAWLAFPRIAFRVLFPARQSVDVMGGMVLHAVSLSLWTWAAFFIAGMCASFITTNVLNLFTHEATEAAVSAGAVKQEDVQDTQVYIMLILELYMLPRIYEAVAASRDEAMYRKVVEKTREHNARRVVVVVGAGHANGILQRTRTFGL